MLHEKIDKLIAETMKSGDKKTLEVLRMIKTEFTYSEKNTKKPVDDISEVAILNNMVSVREKTIEKEEENAIKCGRTEYIEKLKSDIAIIKTFIPAQPKEEDIKVYAEEVLSSYIEEKGASYALSMGDMKPLMARVSEKYQSNLVGKVVSKLLNAQIQASKK